MNLFINDIDQGDGTCVRIPMDAHNATNPINDLDRPLSHSLFPLSSPPSLELTKTSRPFRLSRRSTRLPRPTRLKTQFPIPHNPRLLPRHNRRLPPRSQRRLHEERRIRHQRPRSRRWLVQNRALRVRSRHPQMVHANPHREPRPPIIPRPARSSRRLLPHQTGTTRAPRCR